MHFFHAIWKDLHLTENFYTDMSVVSVTNMRYDTIHTLKYIIYVQPKKNSLKFQVGILGEIDSCY